MFVWRWASKEISKVRGVLRVDFDPTRLVTCTKADIKENMLSLRVHTQMVAACKPGEKTSGMSYGAPAIRVSSILLSR